MIAWVVQDRPNLVHEYKVRKMGLHVPFRRSNLHRVYLVEDCREYRDTSNEQRVTFLLEPRVTNILHEGIGIRSDARPSYIVMIKQNE